MAQSISALRGFLREIRLAADANGRSITSEINIRLQALFSGGDGRSIASTSSGSKSVSFSQNATTETAASNLSYLLDVADDHETELLTNEEVEALMRADDRLVALMPGDSFRPDFSQCQTYSRSS